MKFLDLPGLQRVYGKINAKIDERISRVMIAHVLDSANVNMVLGADVGPKIMQQINAVDQRVDDVSSDLGKFESLISFNSQSPTRYIVQDLSQYRMIAIYLTYNNNQVQACNIIPAAKFCTLLHAAGNYVCAVTSQASVMAAYVDNTTVYCSTSNATYYGQLYGIK